MPFYEYQCKNCGHALEAMQKVNDAPLRKCPHCGKSQLQRLMSAPVFRLKGSGWYETDFKGDQDHKRNLADQREPDASKDSATDTAKDAPKDAAKDADGKGKDGSDKEAAGKEGSKDVKGANGGDAGAKDAVTKDKADKPGAAAASSKGKPDGRKSSSARGRTTVRRAPAKRPVKKPVAKAKRR